MVEPFDNNPRARRWRRWCRRGSILLLLLANPPPAGTRFCNRIISCCPLLLRSQAIALDPAIHSDCTSRWSFLKPLPLSHPKFQALAAPLGAMESSHPPSSTALNHLVNQPPPSLYVMFATWVRFLTFSDIRSTLRSFGDTWRPSLKNYLMRTCHR
jgi:hypothetical protein